MLAALLHAVGHLVREAVPLTKHVEDVPALLRGLSCLLGQHCCRREFVIIGRLDDHGLDRGTAFFVIVHPSATLRGMLVIEQGHVASLAGVRIEAFEGLSAVAGLAQPSGQILDAHSIEHTKACYLGV